MGEYIHLCVNHCFCHHYCYFSFLSIFHFIISFFRLLHCLDGTEVELCARYGTIATSRFIQILSISSLSFSFFLSSLIIVVVVVVFDVVVVVDDVVAAAAAPPPIVYSAVTIDGFKV